MENDDTVLYVPIESAQCSEAVLFLSPLEVSVFVLGIVGAYLILIAVFKMVIIHHEELA